MLEKRVVHFPEFSLRPGCFGNDRRGFDVRMDIGYREMTKDETQIFAHFALNMFNGFIHLDASCGHS